MFEVSKGSLCLESLGTTVADDCDASVAKLLGLVIGILTYIGLNEFSMYRESIEVMSLFIVRCLFITSVLNLMIVVLFVY